MRRIDDLPKHAKPRERIFFEGACSLTDKELLAALLGSGGAQQHVLALATQILKVIDRKGVSLTLEDLLTVKGVGVAKASQIIAALEFSRRRFTNSPRIISAEDVVSEVAYLARRKQEHFICLSLNGAQELIKTRVVTVGLVDMCQVHPREVFAEPLKDRASAIIVAHNHPSGLVIPSEADCTVTKILREAGQLLGVALIDHVIFNHKEYYSFREHGIIL